MTKTVIHVGVGKTGTTSLQNHIFSNLPGADCLLRPNNHTEDCRQFSIGIRFAENYKAESMCRPFVERVHASTKETIILSDESIRFEVDELVAQRLAKFFPGAHILITIRNQLTALPSYYRDSGRKVKRTAVENRPLFVPWDEFFTYAMRETWRWPAREFNYYDLVRAYRGHFDNVTVLAFEEMISAPEFYFGKLAGIVNHDAETLLELWRSATTENPGESSRTITYLNFRSRIPLKRLPVPEFVRRAGRRFIANGAKAEVNMTPQQREIIVAAYAASNSALEREFGLDLAKHGYPLC